MIFLLLLLLGNDGLLTGKFHFNFHFLDVLNFLYIVLLFHFSLPPYKLRCIFQTHFHLGHSFCVFPLFPLYQSFLTLQHCEVQLYIGLILIEVRHLTWFKVAKFEFRLNLGFNLGFNNLTVRCRWSCSRC